MKSEMMRNLAFYIVNFGDSFSFLLSSSGYVAGLTTTGIGMDGILKAGGGTDK